jgi:putative cell wall-binding protein
MIRDIPTADKLIPVLNAGRRLHAQTNKNVKKRMTKPQISTAQAKIKKQSSHVIDTKSKLTKKAKISMKKAKSKKNKYNVK